MTDTPVHLQGFQGLEIGHKPLLAPFFGAADIQASELSFTNLFMWRHLYRPQWRVVDDCLQVVLFPAGEEPFGLRPLGRGDLAGAVADILGAMSAAGLQPRLARVSAEFARAHLDPARYQLTPQPEHFDYVYRVKDLIDLPGRAYHRKKNLLNRFLRQNRFRYWPMDHQCVEEVLEMQKNWCRLRDCGSDLSLQNEDQAIWEALTHFDRLDFVGGSIIIDGKVEAFTLGEPLNPETVVIHIEKANPRIPGLYAAINQMFCQRAWAGMEFVNREQDLGLEGLRAAKQSYHPHHMVEKFVVTPRD